MYAARAVFNGALLTVGVFVLLGLFAGTAFDVFFVAFHRVFFQGDTWLFYYTDSLIQFYPERFWNDTALYLVGATLLEALVLGVVGWVWVRRELVTHQPAPVSAPASVPAQRS
jgi:integral membrane protein (TIGR01906 family)